MQLGMIGLGRMGANIVRRLMRAGHECVVYDVNPEPCSRSTARARPAPPRSRSSSTKLDAPRAVWVMVPAAVAGETVEQLAALLERGRHRHRRRQQLLPRRHRPRDAARSRSGIHYVDVGTSGGVFGLERGYCLMIGGRAEPVAPARPDLQRARARAAAARAHARPRDGDRHRRAGLSALRARRRRPLREDGPQRHRVRPDGRLRRGVERPASTRTPGSAGRRATPRRLRCATRSTTSTTSTSPRSPRCGAAAAWSRRGCSTSPRPRCAEIADARGLRRPRVRLGRGPLDGAGRDRRGRPADVLAAALFARFSSRGQADFADQAAVGDAPSVRRPRRRSPVADATATAVSDAPDAGAARAASPEGPRHRPVRRDRRPRPPQAPARAVPPASRPGCMPEHFRIIGTSRHEPDRRGVPASDARGGRRVRALRPDERRAGERSSSSLYLRARSSERPRRWPRRSSGGARDRRRAAAPATTWRCRRAPSSRSSRLERRERAGRARARDPARSRSAWDLESARALNATLHARLRRVADLPHRPLPRQGGGAEHPRAALRERHVRAGLEPRAHRPRADRRARDARRSRARGSFYEETGAFRDMVVTHLFQVLGFVAMEPPTSLDAEAARRREDEGLRRHAAAATRRTSCAASTSGYRDEPGVAPDSQTETFVAARVHDRQLALGRRAVLPAHRQAHGREPAPADDRVPPAAAHACSRSTATGRRSDRPDHLTFELGDPGSDLAELPRQGPRPDDGARRGRA